MNRSGFDVHGSLNGKLETISRLVQWTLDNLPHRNYYESPPVPAEASPIARIELRVYNFERGRRPTGSPVHKKLLQTDDDFICPMDSTFNDTFRVVVEFLDFKISPCQCTSYPEIFSFSDFRSKEASSGWAYEVSMQYLENKLSRPCLSHTLEEDIHSDVTMNTAGAHCALTRPFWRRTHSSSIAYQVHVPRDLRRPLELPLEPPLLIEVFWKYRMALLTAAEKYDLAGLKECCEESLLEDLTSGNMLQRLRDYWIYKLDRLKKLDHLKECCKVYDVGEGTHEFFCDVDGELMVEMFQAVQTI
ncbi:unnamed protein product [Spirodela intermedia]|uniref:Uncharacterized protein n=1 Tax=Spirodela intermedia TaxID=51605 RepID=A0A7I8JE55_SPIIN|nr:unnamed protein product [Spirodela intermedia]CAA6667672.1 unnamed protein product [Spirodela intermedia]